MLKVAPYRPRTFPVRRGSQTRIRDGYGAAAQPRHLLADETRGTVGSQLALVVAHHIIEGGFLSGRIGEELGIACDAGRARAGSMRLCLAPASRH